MNNSKWIFLGVALAVILFFVWLLTSVHIGMVGAHYGHEECKHDCIPTVILSPTIEQEVTPTVIPDVTSTPEATPTVPPAGHGDGLSDGKSDGLSSCPKCTQPENAASPYDGQPVGWK